VVVPLSRYPVAESLPEWGTDKQEFFPTGYIALFVLLEPDGTYTKGLYGLIPKQEAYDEATFKRIGVSHQALLPEGYWTNLTIRTITLV
jgi:hypothetical protein